MNGITIALIVVAVWLVGAMVVAYVVNRWLSTTAGEDEFTIVLATFWPVLLVCLPLILAVSPLALVFFLILYCGQRGREHRENRRKP